MFVPIFIVSCLFLMPSARSDDGKVTAKLGEAKEYVGNYMDLKFDDNTDAINVIGSYNTLEIKSNTGTVKIIGSGSSLKMVQSPGFVEYIGSYGTISADCGLSSDRVTFIGSYINVILESQCEKMQNSYENRSVSTDEIAVNEEVKRYAGNYLDLKFDDNADTIVVIGNYNSVDIKSNTGTVHMEGNGNSLKMIQSPGFVEYVGNDGTISADCGLSSDRVTYIGNNINVDFESLCEKMLNSIGNKSD